MKNKVAKNFLIIVLIFASQIANAAKDKLENNQSRLTVEYALALMEIHKPTAYLLWENIARTDWGHMQTREFFENDKTHQYDNYFCCVRMSCDQTAIPWALKMIEDKKLGDEHKGIILTELKLLAGKFCDEDLSENPKEKSQVEIINELKEFCKKGDFDCYEKNWAIIVQKTIDKCEKSVEKIRKKKSFQDYQGLTMELYIFFNVFWQSDDLHMTMPLAIEMIEKINLADYNNFVSFNIRLGLNSMFKANIVMDKNDTEAMITAKHKAIRQEILDWWEKNKNTSEGLLYINQLGRNGYEFEDKTNAKKLCRTLLSIISKGDTVETFAAIEAFNCLFPDQPEVVSYRPNDKFRINKRVRVAEELIRAEALRQISMYSLTKAKDYYWNEAKGVMVEKTVEMKKKELEEIELEKIKLEKIRQELGDNMGMGMNMRMRYDKD